MHGFTVSAHTNNTNWKEQYQNVMGQILDGTISSVSGCYDCNNTMMAFGLALEFSKSIFGLFDLGSDKDLHENGYDGRGIPTKTIRPVGDIKADIVTTSENRQKALAKQDILAKGLTTDTNDLDKLYEIGINPEFINTYKSIINKDSGNPDYKAYQGALNYLNGAKMELSNYDPTQDPNGTKKKDLEDAVRKAEHDLEEAIKNLKDNEQEAVKNLEEAIKNTKVRVDKEVAQLEKELDALNKELAGAEKSVVKDNSGIMKNDEYNTYFTESGEATVKTNDDKKTAEILRKAVAEYLTAKNKSNVPGQKLAQKKINSTLKLNGSNNNLFDYNNCEYISDDNKTLIKDIINIKFSNADDKDSTTVLGFTPRKATT